MFSHQGPSIRGPAQNSFFKKPNWGPPAGNETAGPLHDSQVPLPYALGDGSIHLVRISGQKPRGFAGGEGPNIQIDSLITLHHSLNLTQPPTPY